MDRRDEFATTASLGRNRRATTDRPRQRERATRHAAPCSSRTDSAPEALLCVAAVAAPLSCFIHDVNILFSASVRPSRRNQSSSARSVRPQIGSLFLRRQSGRQSMPATAAAPCHLPSPPVLLLCSRPPHFGPQLRTVIKMDQPSFEFRHRHPSIVTRVIQSDCLTRSMPRSRCLYSLCNSGRDQITMHAMHAGMMSPLLSFCRAAAPARLL